MRRILFGSSIAAVAGVLILFAAPATLAPVAAANALPVRSPVGVNLDGVAAWSPQLPFVNVMKASTDWISGDGSRWDNGLPLDLDPSGWVRSLVPGQVARKLMLREIGTNYPAGRYLVRYQGEGILNFGFAAKVISRAPGKMVLEVSPESGGIHLFIESTNPLNYVRDIEITMAGGICDGDPFTHVPSAKQCGSRRHLPYAEHHERILFNPAFAARLRSYSVLRFLDWMRTNNSRSNTWYGRAGVTDASWAGERGVPLEVMLALANLVGAHPWFTLPHQADAAFVERFAKTVRQQLRPDLGVFVEHSNEVWNSQFSQYAYAVQQAKLSDPQLDNFQYHALRTRSIGAAFASALGEPRVMVVLGAQAGNPWTAAHALDFLAQRFGASSIGIDAVAIAPYLGVSPTPAEAAKFTGMTLDAFFDHVRGAVLPQAAGWMSAHANIAKQRGLGLIAYEGGQHMVGIHGAENSDSLNALFDAFNRDPRIRDLYRSYLDAWKSSGGELFVHYTDVGRYNKWGRWGALEYVSQPRESAPKFDALQTFIELNPPWWKQPR